MKKKRASRTKHSKKTCFNQQRLFAIGIAAFLVFAFLLTVVNVSQTNITGFQTKTGKPGGSSDSFIDNFFTSWKGGNLDINIAKYLFWITLLLLIFSALKFAKFPDNGFLQFLLALIVSFLATAFITPEEVFVMLISYSALGLTLGSVLPFIIILFFSAMLVSTENIRKMSVAKIMLQVVIWLLWVGFLIYRFIKLWADQGFDAILKGGGLVMVVVFVLSVIVLIFNPKFRKWIAKLGIEVMRRREEAISAGQQERARSRRAEHQASERWEEPG